MVVRSAELRIPPARWRSNLVEDHADGLGVFGDGHVVEELGVPGVSDSASFVSGRAGPLDT